jgi:predicted hydrocarbon binding protein
MAVTPIMQRILATRAIKLKDGKLRIWGIPAAIYSLFSICYITRLLEKGYAGKDVLYWAGYYQANAATHTMRDRFGYKKKVIENVVNHNYMLGLGLIDARMINLKKKRFVISSKSEVALEYLKEFGIQQHPVCHFFRGQSAGLITALFEDEEFLAVETKCIAMGNTSCEVVVKPINDWNLSDEFVNNQVPRKMPSPADIGYKRVSSELPQRES